jgi:hypothetical protein
MKKPSDNQQLTEQQTIQRRDEAVRRALNTPPKPYKDAKVGKAKPKTSPPTGNR